MRLGIIGPGLIWQQKHKTALARYSDTFTVAAFCASTEQRRAEVLRDFPGASFDTDVPRFVARPDVDAVVVLTPIPLNAAVALQAIEAGKDVFVEKPMAHTAEGGAAIVQAARRFGRSVRVLEQQPYEPLWGALRTTLAAGTIGEPVYFDQVIHWPLDAGRNDRGGFGRTAWRASPGYPLGAFFDGGHHQVAVLSTLFGQPDWVFASGVRLRPEFGEVDHVVVQLGYASRVRGVLSHSAVLSPLHNSFTIWGTGGSIRVFEDRLEIAAADGAMSKIEVARVDAHAEMWGALARCASAGGEPPYGLAQASGDLAVLLAVDRSIREGIPVEPGRGW